jgi:site-specific recombinase XerC
MTALAPYLSGFLREHLPKERRASQHTCEAYAQSFQLLLVFAAGRLKITPAKIEVEQLDAPLMLAFLEHLEKKRGNSARTRNARLAAINSLFRFLDVTARDLDADRHDKSMIHLTLEGSCFGAGLHPAGLANSSQLVGRYAMTDASSERPT